MRLIPACITVLATVVQLTFHDVHATIVEYKVQSLGGTHWQYDYTVFNDSGLAAIKEFTIMFAPDSFANLAAGPAVAHWDGLAVAPDSNIPAPGFFDSLALTDGIAFGGLQGGFSVSFNYLAAGIPGAQAFDILDPVTFQVLFSGVTTPVAAVPEPASLAMWTIGGALLVGLRRNVRPAQPFGARAVARARQSDGAGAAQRQGQPSRRSLEAPPMARFFAVGGLHL